MRLPKSKTIEKILGVKFRKKGFLKTALTHSSYAQSQKNHDEDRRSNENLEFLGDAVLELIVRDYLYHEFPNSNEGELSELKKMYTNAETLSKIGQALDLGAFLIMDKGEKSSGGRDRPSNLACCLEAIIGALYFDRGLKYARKFVHRVILAGEIAHYEDFKSMVNQWAMKNGHKIAYRTVREDGLPHCKTFQIALYLDRKKVGFGTGKSKKRAEQEAAQSFLEKSGLLTTLTRVKITEY